MKLRQNVMNICRNLTHGSVAYLSEFYTDKQSYDNLRNILLEGNYTIDYKVADYFDFSKTLKGKYDFIMLSNIYIVSYNQRIMPKLLFTHIGSVIQNG